ncbi:ATP-dependent RNA helicase SUV3, mitochondrial [Chionoecetes opilio]|uniref:ATP-dependent RNA helicase SUV3, mitochondrial n=1 Tax=Chionoecetes opilio TaxID=41210 RepID=A0A8J4Y4U3_CHIOP|nr:ATP-dependent RNA helicase SUV3, mitochondrial [Chionoecetes opilio]
MERFLTAESGIYCGPLKLLANEVFNKSNTRGTPCDLVTGEERRNGNTDGQAARHLACTVEMASVTTACMYVCVCIYARVCVCMCVLSQNFLFDLLHRVVDFRPLLGPDRPTVSKLDVSLGPYY